MSEPVLEVEDLTVDFPRLYGSIGLLRDVNLTLAEGECLGLVGESGSGKSLLGLSLMGLQASTARMSGSIRLRGQELLGAPERVWRGVRGTEMSMVYQDALVSLNPGMRIEAQLQQCLRHEGAATPGEMLEAVKIRDVDRCLRAYPHELSGGQRQRVLIAMAISGRPRVVVADEPTTALDVTVQAQVIGLLNELRAELGFGLVFISHDLGLVASTADRVAVMYGGEIVEVGPVRTVLDRPEHPYTAGLVASSRSLEAGSKRLSQIPGVVPPPREFAAACRFAPRCGRAQSICREVRPVPADASSGALVACHFPLGVDAPRAADEVTA